MKKIGMLRHIYDVYEDWTGQFSFACTKSCASCCTQSVTMTSLEGRVIMSFLKRRGRAPELESALKKSKPAASPAVTTNQFAEDCLAQKGPENDDPMPWDFTPCIFLDASCCSIYPVRPFGCRGFGSILPCTENREAEVPPLLITVNTVVMQIIEHLDSEGGLWGNMMDVLRNVSGCQTTDSGMRLLTAQPNPGFLVEPGEREPVNGFLEALSNPSSKEKAMVGGGKCMKS